MEFGDVLLKRRSVRKFTDEEVTKDQLNKILQAGLLAPTSRNRKPCNFLVVSNKETLKELADVKEHGSKFLSDANKAIIVCGIEVGHTHPIEFIAEAIHLRQESLKTQPCGEMAVGIVDLAETVDAELLAFEVVDANAFIEHIVLSVSLESAVHLAVLQKRLCFRLEADRQGECE